MSKIQLPPRPSTGMTGVYYQPCRLSPSCSEYLQVAFLRSGLPVFSHGRKGVKGHWTLIEDSNLPPHKLPATQLQPHVVLGSAGRPAKGRTPSLLSGGGFHHAGAGLFSDVVVWWSPCPVSQINSLVHQDRLGWNCSVLGACLD